MNTLTNKDIFEILDNLNIKINGIFYKDKLPEKLLKGFYIINLQSSDKGNGTHWTALFYDGFSTYIYWDSFGLMAPIDIENKISKNYYFNDNDIQDINSSSCGYYCIAFIKFLNGSHDKIKAFKSFVKIFSNKTNRNEEILYKILYD